MLIKSELFKIWKSKKSLFFIVIMILIPFIDLFSNVIVTYGDYWLNKELYVDGLSSSMKYIPAMAGFLSGNSEGHIAQMLLIHILPIYLMIIYCDSYVNEVQCGYNNILFSKIERKVLIRSRFIVSFLVPFIITMISLIINFILAYVIFYDGTYTSGLEGFDSAFLQMCLGHPNIAYMLYMVVYSLIAGGCGMFCLGVCFLIPNNRIAYPVVFLIWIIQIIYPISITYAIQPFIEYGPDYFVPALAVYFSLVIGITVISYNYKVRYDEI